MAEVKLNSIIDSIQGELEGYVFRRTPSGRTFISKKPDMSGVKSSPAQKAHRENFKQAVAYAHLAKNDPEMWAFYEQAAKNAQSQPFRLAVSAYFRVQNLQLD